MRTDGAFTFGPDSSYMRVNYVYLVLAFLIGLIWWYVPVLLLAPWEAAVVATAIVAPMFILAAVWIPLYHRSISYRLDPEELEWRRGVWFRTTGVVPYNRITNIDIKQGPISRAMGISSLNVQTAGYSAQNAASEISLVGLTDPEGMRDRVLSLIRMGAPVATETAFEEGGLIEEVRSIRRILEGMDR